MVVGIGFPTTSSSGSSLLTGDQLLDGFSRFINDYWSSTTTSAGLASGGTIVDSKLGRFGDDQILDYYVRITGAGGTQYEVQRVSQFISATGTIFLTPGFSAQVGTAVTYSLHRYDPADKFNCLDNGRLREDVFERAFALSYNDDVTSDGVSDSYPVDPEVRSGPLYVFVENPIDPDAAWNVLNNGVIDSTSEWTTSGAGVTVVADSTSDRLVPKYDSSCLRLAIAAGGTGLLQQTSSTWGITASDAAGRTMTFGMWVYCEQAGHAYLKLEDDALTSTSSTHLGKGWELLTLTKEISGTNATKLEASLQINGLTDGVTVFANRAWLYYGTVERIQDIYPWRNAKLLRRDATTQRIGLSWVPPAGRQIRMVGRKFLSALGDLVTSQGTNTMELDEASALILYGAAASELFERQAVTTEEFDMLARRLQLIDRKKSAVQSWGYNVPEATRIRSPYE